MSEDKKNSRHLTHALIMVALWVPVLALELSLLQDSVGAEANVQKPANSALILAVLMASVGLMAGVLWKMFLYFRGR